MATFTPKQIDSADDGGVAITSNLTAVGSTNEYTPKKAGLAHIVYVRNADASPTTLTIPSEAVPAPGETKQNVTFVITAGDDGVIRVGEWARRTRTGSVKLNFSNTTSVSAAVFFVK